MMKVRILIPGSSVSVEMNDDKSRKVFSKLARELLIYGSSEDPETKNADARSDREPESNSTVDTEEDADESDLGESIPEDLEKEITEVDENDTGSKKYKGFMYIKCPSCGSIKGFNMKKPSDHYHCDSCGTRSGFKDSLVPLFINCECGKKFLYMTNMEEPMFDIDCLECRAPVTVQWNGKKRIYETIRR